MIAFRNWPNEFLSIESPCFHAVSFVSKFIYRIYIIYIAEYVVVHCILFHSKTKITLFYLSAIRYHSLYYSFSFFVSLVVIRCHSLSLVVIRCTTLCHSLSIDVTLVCLFINDQFEK